ncbi:hypothetical protein GCM10009425_18170 [Pseudomonas asuensis]|uniref:Uncharacterized protein n=1 Tax=Pseudomonas asuensis TaxID=1825787 RepID=A0ABQ2GQ07_9PSED|nr:hypothetical protein GCM10009425_18170 [Pseudomonas asuensis]
MIDPSPVNIKAIGPKSRRIARSFDIVYSLVSASKDRLKADEQSDNVPRVACPIGEAPNHVRMFLS